MQQAMPKICAGNGDGKESVATTTVADILQDGPLPYCTTLLKSMAPELCASDEDADPAGEIPEAMKAYNDLQVLPFCFNWQQKQMPNICPEKACNGVCPGNGGGLTPSSSTTEAGTDPRCTTDLVKALYPEAC